MKVLLFLLTSLMTFIVTSHSLSSPISVPLHHWSYRFIERLQAKGILKDFLSNTKPYSRDEVAKMIIHLSDLSDRLTGIEKAQLEIMKREFAPELTELGMSNIIEYGHLLNWSDGGKRLVTEVGYTQDTISKAGSEDYEIYRSTLQVILWGDLKGGLFFYNDSRASYAKSEEPLPLIRSYPWGYWRYPWSAISDAYLIFRLPWADIQVGKDAVLWGPGYHGVVGLSGVGPTFDIIKLPIQIWKVKFTSLLGFLRDDLTKEYQSDVVRKYLSAHRVEMVPFPGICIGWQEVYVYAENLHIELLNPIMPYQMAEDYLGEIGNNTMEGDIDICILPNTRLYMAIFLDDFHPDKSFFRYAGNRWAALGGIFVVDPFRIKNSDFRAEYARVEPWAYSHKGTIQDPPIPTSYKHFDTPLGHWIGPNADDLLLSANYQLSRDLLAKASYNRIRKGEIGANPYDYDAKAVNGEKRFLMGIVEKTHTVSLGLKYRIFQDSEMEITFSHTKVRNKQKEEAKLPSTDKRKQPWSAGRSWSQNILQATLTLRY